MYLILLLACASVSDEPADPTALREPPHKEEMTLEAALMVYDTAVDHGCVYARTDKVNTFRDPDGKFSAGYIPRRTFPDDGIAHWTVFPVLSRANGFVKTVTPEWKSSGSWHVSSWQPDMTMFQVAYIPENDVAGDYHYTREFVDSHTFTSETAFPLRCPNVVVDADVPAKVE